MKKWVVLAGIALFLAAGRISTTGYDARPVQQATVDLRAAEQAVYQQINRDRAAYGLQPVAWDETAAEAARRHAQEMASYDYLSHWNLAGKKPAQRYTEAGGMFRTSENASITQAWNVPAGTEYVRQAMLGNQAGMMAEQPPDDGHRQNILNPLHTHVGVGAAYATDGDKLVIAFTEEFTDHYVRLQGIPAAVAPGQPVAVTGQILVPGWKVESVVLVWEEAPYPQDAAALNDTGSYSGPEWEAMTSYALPGWPRQYYAGHRETGGRVTVNPDGSFTTVLRASARPGLNYLWVWLKDDHGQSLQANEVVIVVR